MIFRTCVWQQSHCAFGVQQASLYRNMEDIRKKTTTVLNTSFLALKLSFVVLLCLALTTCQTLFLCVVFLWFPLRVVVFTTSPVQAHSYRIAVLPTEAYPISFSCSWPSVCRAWTLTYLIWGVLGWLLGLRVLFLEALLCLSDEWVEYLTWLYWIQFPLIMGESFYYRVNNCCFS